MGESGGQWRFDPVDIEQMRALARIPAGRRIGAMLAAQETARGFILGRLRRQYPQATSRELATKVGQD